MLLTIALLLLAIAAVLWLPQFRRFAVRAVRNGLALAGALLLLGAVLIGIARLTHG